MEKSNFKLTDWSFDVYTDWLKDVKLPDDDKKYIKAKTEKMSKTPASNRIFAGSQFCRVSQSSVPIVKHGLHLYKI